MFFYILLFLCIALGVWLGGQISPVFGYAIGGLAGMGVAFVILSLLRNYRKRKIIEKYGYYDERPQIGCKTILYFIIAIIAVISFLGQETYNFIMNQTTGCTNDLLTRFISSDIANQYQKSYVQQIRTEDANAENHVDWSISRHSNGCQISGSVKSFKKTFIGDNFLVDPQTHLVTPNSAGAETFYRYFNGSRYLP